MFKRIRIILLVSGLSLVFLSSTVFLSYQNDSGNRSDITLVMRDIIQAESFHNVLRFGIILTIASQFFAIFVASEEHKDSIGEDLEGYYQSPKSKMTWEEREQALAELAYIIQKIEQKLEVKTELSWHWEIKLKSANFTRSKLLGDDDPIVRTLSEEEKRRLEKESPLLTLKEYDQETQTDLPTRQSIKSKMALYSQHRKEQI